MVIIHREWLIQIDPQPCSGLPIGGSCHLLQSSVCVALEEEVESRVRSGWHYINGSDSSLFGICTGHKLVCNDYANGRIGGLCSCGRNIGHFKGFEHRVGAFSESGNQLA